MPECLKLLNQYFPISEGSFYALYRKDDRPPCQGFLQVLSAFYDLNRDIEEVILHPGAGLLKGRLPMLSTSNMPEHLRVMVVSAFNQIRNLDLTVHLLGIEIQDHQDFAASHTFLSDALCNCLQIQSLALRFDHRMVNKEAYAEILPMSHMLGRLHTPKLENMSFSQPDASRLLVFLLEGLPSLANLALLGCDIESTWHDFFQSLSDAKRFRIKSIEIAELEDILSTLSANFPPEPGQGRDYRPWSVASNISNQPLLHFVNNPGSRNPFKDQKWRFEDDLEPPEPLEVSAYQLLDSLASEGVIIDGAYQPTNNAGFDDMSDWEPGTTDQQSNKFESEDPDGPEFNSEYDFDAESDSDEDSETDGNNEMIDSIA